MTPSGHQTELRHGDQRAVVVEVGGGLRTYQAGGADLLDGYPEDQMASAGRGQVLAPWPNRLHTGRYTWDGAEHVVPVNEPAQQNASHGLVRWRSWTAEQQSESSATLSLRLRPEPAYPFGLLLEVDYRLGDDGLEVTHRATNEGDVDAPYGCGAHPYLTVGTDLVDDATLQVPAASWLPTGTSQVPVGQEDVEGSPYDFRTSRRIGRLRLDYAFTDLDRDGDGRATVTLQAGDRQVGLWLGEGFGYVGIFTGDTLPAERRRRGLAVEPMTCPADAFRSGTGVLRLAPGQTTSATWGIRP